MKTLIRQAADLRQAMAGIFLMFMLAIAGGQELCAQTPVYQVKANQQGFALSKIVSNTTINTGQTFVYTINVTIPAGATNVTITDQLPAGLQYLNSSYLAPCIGTVTVSAPAVNSMGSTYTMNVASAPNGCVITISITVRFPNGTTCNGEKALNKVCIVGQDANKHWVEFCTDFLTVTAVAVNPWHINKYPLNVAYTGDSCAYASADSIITYQLYVWKDVGTTGQLNLVNGVVTDVLPPGAVLVSSNCGATQSGNTITWNVNNMSAIPMFNGLVCDIKVLYPPLLYPLNSLISNKATLQGTLGTPTKNCGPVNITSNETCVTIKQVRRGYLNKAVYTTGQPGCAGKYTITFCNTGTQTFFNYSIIDTLPPGLTGYTFSASPGLSLSFSGGILTATNTAPLPMGQCVTIDINFTIPSTMPVNTPILNCANAKVTLPATPIPPHCAFFKVNAPAPQVCVWKEVCNKQVDYLPGSIVRYRLRLQNIGGQAITGAAISDVLNPNLTYVGSPAFYTSTSWNIPCGTGTPWVGPTVSYSGGPGGTVSVSNININPSCQNVFYGNCGQYGNAGVPFYFVEFSVLVLPTSAIGNIPNRFTIGGGTLPGIVTSNTEYITVVGTAGFNISKGVRPTGSTGAYTPSVNTTPGASLDYRLNMNLGGGTAALTHATLADELPRNQTPNDRFILNPCITPMRGSAFDITYNAGSSASTPPSTLYNQGAVTDPNVNGLSFTGVGSIFSTGCGTAPTWTTGIPPTPTKNLAWYFGAGGVSGILTADFKGTVSPTAQVGTTACNTFAANGALAHLINSVNLVYIPLGPGLESGKACATIIRDTLKNCCVFFNKGVNVTSINRVAAAGMDNVTMNMSFTPSRRIRNATFTIVSASRRMLVPFGAWQRIFGDIKGGTLIPSLINVSLGGQAPSTSFVPTSFQTRELEWGTNMGGVFGPLFTSVTMLFPSAPSWPQVDELEYFVRIEMTDTNCIQCDTLIRVNMRRQNFFKTGPIATTNTGIVMATRDNGTLTVTVPENETGEEDIQVVSIGVKANQSTMVTAFTCESGNFTPVPPSPDEESDGALYCQGSMGNGEQATFNVGFNNPLADNWNNTVIISYRLNGSEELYSEEVIVAAAAPVYGEGDKLAELNDGVTGARTYALWFENANAAGHPIKNVQLHLPDGVNLLAYGSGLNNNQKLEATASFDADGNKIQNYLIPVQDADRAASTITTGETVTPIYITVSGGADVIDLGFTTIDEGGSTMTNGTVQLTSPVYIISGGQNDDGSSDNVQSSVPAPGIQELKPSLIMNVYPNPATNSATINLGVESKETVSMTVSDINGREVTVLCNESTLLSGNHIFTLNTTGLTDGTYLIVAKNQNGEVVTTQLKVVK